MAITLSRKSEENGIRPMKPSRDLQGVAGLIEEAFAVELDRSGRAALREMRLMGHWGFLLLWLDYLSPDVNTHLNGFVWVDNGRIVGNVTVSRNSQGSKHWFISNVAVAKSHRRQGIARAFMETAVDFVKETRGHVVSLQVRQGNEPAVRLYESMGFRYISAISYLYLPTVKEVPDVAWPEGTKLRDHRLNLADATAAYNLARVTVPLNVQMQRPLRQSQFRIGSDVNFQNFWRGLFGWTQIKHWIVEDTAGKCIATMSLTPGIWHSESKIAFMVHPDWWGRLEAPLLSTMLSYLKANFNKRPIAFQHPAEHETGIQALESFGFINRRTHICMKLNL
jgi:ribosomal protein S18 acetylase RimI-like enzyme